MSNIEEPRNPTAKQEKNNKTAMNIVKTRGGGGGIGIGIIFLGGAVATAAFLFITRRRKSSHGKTCKKSSQSTASAEIPYKVIEDKSMNEDKGLRFVVANSSPHLDVDQDLRNGTSSIGVHESDNTMISDETSFFRDEKEKLEVNGRNEDPVAADCQDDIHSISSEVLDGSMQFDASALKEKEFQTPILVEEKTLLQPTVPENELAVQEIVYIKEENADGTALVDQGIEEESCQDLLVNIEGGETDANSWEEEGKGGLQNKDTAETTKADQSMLNTMQSSEEQESPIDGGEESTSIGDLVPKTSEFAQEVSVQPMSGNSSPSNEGNLGNDSEESALDIKVPIVEKDEELDEEANDEQDKGDTTTQIIEVEDTLCPECFGVNETNENAHFKDQASRITTNSMFAEVEQKCNQHDSTLTIRTKENEAVEAIDASQVEGNSVIHMPEEEENLKKSQVGVPIGEALEVAEEVKVHEEAEDKEKTDILMGGEEKGAQHDGEMTGEQSEETRETAQLPDNSIFASNHQEPQMDTIETSLNGYQEDNSATDEPTCQGSSASVPNVPLTLFDTPDMKHEIHADNGFKEIQQSAVASELKNENVESEPGFEDRVVESEDLPIQLAEKQEYLDDEYGRTLKEAEDTVQLRYERNITTEEQKQMTSEEDANNDTEESNTTEKVDESSEGTADSSAESNAEPIWPAESIQDLTMEPEKMEANSKEILQLPNEEEIEYVESLEDNGIPGNRLQKGNDDKGNLKLTLLERYMVQLAELTHQTTNSQKRRILILTIMVLSGSLGIWYFGLPFLKICLIIILIMIISKMHGI